MNGHPDDARHVATCADCQARLGMENMDVNLEKVWRSVATELWARRIGLLERMLGHLFGSPGLARALLTTPSLVVSWIIASAVVLSVGVFATYNTGQPWTALLAPALAGVGIAYAYGPGVDPAWELSQTMVVSSRSVLLVRCLAVFGVNALLGVVASAFAGLGAELTWGWLVPMVAVCALALAASSLSCSANVGVVAALASWSVVVTASAMGQDHLSAAVSQLNLLPVYAVAAAVFLAVAVYATSARRGEVSVWR